VALAILRSLGVTAGDVPFEADIGTNTHYRYAVGTGRSSDDGFDTLEGVTYASPIRQGSQGGLFQSWFGFTIPRDQLDRENRFVQLSSYKDAEGRSPAWSKVLEVWPQLPPRPFPEQTTDMTLGMTRDTILEVEPAFEPCRSVAHTLTENRLSAAMFWEELLNIARLFVPAGSQLLGQLVNSRTNGQVNPDDIGNIITSLLNVVGQIQAPAAATNPGTGGNGAGTASAPANGAPTNRAPTNRAPNGTTSPGTQAATAMPTAQTFVARGPRTVSYRQLRRQRSPNRGARRPDNPLGYSRGQDAGLISGPALIGLITTLAPSVLSAIKPLLEKSPELVNAYLDSPLRLFNAVAEAERKERELTNAQIQNMLNQGNQALLYNLLLNQPASPNPAAGGPLAGLLPTPILAGATGLRARSLSVAGPRVDPRIEARLVVPETTDVAGKSRALYRYGEPIAFSVVLGTVDTAPRRPIPKAIAHLRVKDALDGRTLLEHRYQLKDLVLNQAERLDLSPAQAQALPANTDLLVSVDISWLGKSGQVYTTADRATQSLYLTGEYFLKSVGGRLYQELSLKDPIRYRAFWHRIWEGGSAQHRRWELKATSRYYYRLRPDHESNGRIDTKFKAVEARSKESESRIEWGGFLKSGMELAPGELNKLLPLMQQPATWPEAELNALKSEDFAKSVDQQATVDLNLRGRSDERGSVWVFPVVDLVDVTLQKVTATGLYGEVTGTDTVQRVFPVPVAAVFVGMENES
jgi:hypothetical protein